MWSIVGVLWFGGGPGIIHKIDGEVAWENSWAVCIASWSEVRYDVWEDKRARDIGRVERSVRVRKTRRTQCYGRENPLFINQAR